MKALLLVDIQNDFCPGGALAVTDGDTVIEPANMLIRSFEKSGLPVVFTQDWHPENHSSFAGYGGIWPTHCVAGTEGANLHPGLEIIRGALTVYKADTIEKDAYSGFENTRLDAELKSLGVDELVVAGLATDYCIKNTVLDAVKLGYKTSVAEDAIRAVNIQPTDEQSAIDEMKKAGAVFFKAEELLS